MMFSLKKPTKPSDETFDLILSKKIDPITSEEYKLIRQQATKFMQKQLLLESSMSKKTINIRRREIEMRRNLDIETINEIMMHPYFKRMMRFVFEEMINSGLWRYYKPNNYYRDTETSKRRIQPEIGKFVMYYILKYSKKPWRYQGKNKLKTKIYEELDWVVNPYEVVEDNVERRVNHTTM